MTKFLKDERGRSISEEDVALAWIRSNPDKAQQVIGAGRRGALDPRPFQIHAKAAGDGKVRIERAADEPA